MKDYELKDAAPILGKTAGSLRRDCIAGEIPGAIQVAWGKRHKWVIPEGVLASLLSEAGQPDYEKLVDEWRMALRSGLITKTRNPASENTIEFYEAGLVDLWKFSQASPGIKNLNYQTVLSAVLGVPFQADKENDGFSRKNRILSSAKSFYRFLIHKGLKSKSELDDLSEIKPKRSFRAKKSIIRENHFMDLIAANESIERGRDDDGFHRELTKTILYLLGYAGLRKSEPVALTLDDVDLVNGELSVIGKGNKRDIVGMCPELVSQIEKWTQEYRPVAIKNMKKRLGKTAQDSGFLLLHYDGTPYTKAALRQKIRYLSAKTGIPCTPHTFRRFCATYHADHGVPLSHIQVNLRHSRIGTTEGYILTDKRSAIDSFRRVKTSSPPPQPETPPKAPPPKSKTTVRY